MSIILNLYSNSLKTKPFITTCISTSVCFTAGDYFAQSIEKKQHKRQNVDCKRLAVYSTFGLIAGGPIFYGWFSKIKHMESLIEKVVKWNEKRIIGNYYKNKIMNYNLNDKKTAIEFAENFQEKLQIIDKPVIRSKTVLAAKVLADQFLFSSIYTGIYMFGTGTGINMVNNMDKIKSNGFYNVLNDSVNASWKNTKNKYVDIYVADCALWPMVQMINYAFVPSHLQPIYFNVINVGWNTFLSYASQGH